MLGKNKMEKKGLSQYWESIKLRKREPSQYWESIKRRKTAFPTRGNTKTLY